MAVEIKDAKMKTILWEIGQMPKFPLIVLLVFIITALLGQFFAPFSPVEASLPNQLLTPGSRDSMGNLHLLGTDTFGRDILSRVIHGARISLIVALLAIFFAGTIGTLIGLLAGYLGGWVDALLMRTVDLALSLPAFLMAIILAVIVGQSFGIVVVVVSFLLWPRYARQIYGETLQIKHQEFIDLAKVGGCGTLRILIQHIFPNVVPTLLVLATWQVGYVILLESSLSFLGVGIPPPSPAWGLMVSEGRGHIASAWWISLFPGLAILLVVLAINLLGDWLRDRLDPKLATA
jgi:peptide/nickel transport system permease protein